MSAPASALLRSAASSDWRDDLRFFLTAWAWSLVIFLLLLA